MINSRSGVLLPRPNIQGFLLETIIGRMAQVKSLRHFGFFSQRAHTRGNQQEKPYAEARIRPLWQESIFSAAGANRSQQLLGGTTWRQEAVISKMTGPARRQVGARDQQPGQA
ncbi:MAG: hypothetical protein ACFHX7_04150 [Pseudomonadota bacterium]